MLGNKFTIPVKPRTKKNHGQLVTLKTGRQLMLPSKAYQEFLKDIIAFFKHQDFVIIDKPINLKCLFYKDKNYKSDLTGYLQAIQDALVDVGFLEDDNSRIVVSTDGSRVYLDRENPRIEIEITESKDEQIN